ncbi:hypothetical protein [Virgisporangium ochraceum]|uniref:hypothetical protein n=1 Tax=Virgisporangium ochraceum TaxID=65505 RepID=UPI001943E8EC|nr:hypothetical protein [Virgisporangium ochraceum]
MAYYRFVREDPGVAACKAIRDGQVGPQDGTEGKEITETEYRAIRKQFADSRHDDIRDHGTKLVDVIWQIQQLPEGEEMGALAFLGPMATHVTGLQSACADQGVEFTLTPGEDAGSSGDPSGEDATSASPVATEGSAASAEGRSVTFPDGITLTLDKVEQMPRRLASDLPADRAIVRVTWTFRNTSSEAVPLEPYSRYLTVLSGPNRVRGEAEAGYSTKNPDEQLQTSEEATRIAPGGSVTMFESSTVPAADLGDLTVQIEPVAANENGAWEPYTFTDAETMLVTR